MNKKIKIVHCLNHYLPSHMAGTEIYTHTLIREQQKAGHDVSVLIPYFDHENSGPFREFYRYDGVDVFQYHETSSPNDRAVVLGKEEPKGLKDFIVLLAQMRPGLVHFQELNRSIGLRVEHVKAAKNAGAAVFLTMHLSGYSCNTNVLVNNGHLCKGMIREYDCTVCSLRTFNKLPALYARGAAAMGMLAVSTGLNRLLPAGKPATLLSMPASIHRIKKELDELTRNVDQLISLTEWYKKILIANGVAEDKITVIPQQLAGTGEVSLRQNADPAGLPIKLIFVGRIQPQKGLGLLIDAVSSFPSEKLTLDIYGKPEPTAYDEECRKKAAGLAGIRWMGVLGREELLGRLSAYDLLCLPSTFSEMSPLVIQEAFAAGIPVLASEVYGNKEQITHDRNGLLFTLNDVAALKNQLQRVVEKPSMLDDMKRQVNPPGTFQDTEKRYRDLIEKFLP